MCHRHNLLPTTTSFTELIGFAPRYLSLIRECSQLHLVLAPPLALLLRLCYRRSLAPLRGAGEWRLLGVVRCLPWSSAEYAKLR